jgi:hypothetical protein
VTDLSPLADLPLAALDVRETKVANLSPLRSSVLGRSLRELLLWKTNVKDLSPLAGCTALEYLDAYGLPLADLSILKGMKLKTLLIGSSRVTDISPLAGMPLESLNLDVTAVKDLSPLLKCPTLKQLVLPRAPDNIESLHGLAQLERLSFKTAPGGAPDKTTVQFWADYDRGHAASATAPQTAPAKDPNP